MSDFIYAKEKDMNGIGWAVKELQNGNKVRRAGWKGKGMFLVLVPGSKGPIDLHPGTPYYKAVGPYVQIDSHVDMYTAQGTMQPGWLCSQADLLATDWETA